MNSAVDPRRPPAPAKSCRPALLAAALAAGALCLPAALAGAAPGTAATELAAAFDRGLPLALLAVFLVGLALNLTPCVYPMIAVTVSLFSGPSDSRPGRAGVQALVYVLGMAAMYSALGATAALTGGLFGGLLQSRAVLAGISVMFILLALSMFGLYELRLPSALVNRLGNLRPAGLAGIFLSGLLVGVFAAPCIGPPTIALLALVGQRGDPLFGFLVFFVLSLGLGAPYLVLGTFAGVLRKMPRAGAWMVWVRKLLGIILVGIALFYLSLAFRPALALVLVPLTLAAGGGYLGFLDRTESARRGFVWFKRLAGAGAITAGVLLFAAGRQPAAEWTPYTPERLQAAGRPALLYFGADWCIPCLELDRRTFTDPAVIRELGHFARFKVDLTHYDSPPARAIRDRFTIAGVPSLVFLDTAGRELPDTRRVGFVGAAEMRRHLAQVRSARPGTAAAAAPPPPDEAEPSRARLVAEVEWVQPGRPFQAGILLQMRAGWHTYWINPGDSGAAPQIRWILPPGFAAGPLQWPHPQRFDDPPFATFGHEGNLLLACEIRPPTDLAAGAAVTLAAELNWLVCRDACVAQRAALQLPMAVRAEPPAPATAWRETFAQAAARLPVSHPGWEFTVSAAGGDLKLTVTPPAGSDAAAVMASEFFPVQPGFIGSGPSRWQPAGAGAALILKPQGPAPADHRLRGVLVLPESEASGLPRALAVDAALPGHKPY